MPLEKYRSKRDFGRTPEPAGGEPGGPGLRFVVQRHAASRLHYDFRLELDGVLLSWAVPKGPSLDPADKRLAVRVEDHPLDYADFEGVIPQGEYGGGTVIVWDSGTWEPLSSGAAGVPDADGASHARAGLAKGDFKFRLRGSKLTGTWVLVRLRPRGGERAENWLLIKERDDHARPRSEYDVLAEHPESVVSGRTNDELDDTERRETAEPPATVTRPTGEPGLPPLALCTPVSTPPTTGEWLSELKYDGYRLRVEVADGTARAFSRTDRDVSERYPAIVRAAASLPVSDALLDGEAVVLDDDGASQFELLQSALASGGQQVVFIAFDLLRLNGRNLTDEPTTHRKDLLLALLRDEPHTGPLRFAQHVAGAPSELLEAACAQRLEGVVCKLADAPYPSGRTHAWLKLKCRQEQEFVIGGFTTADTPARPFGALLVGVHDESGRLAYAGRVGSGLTDADLVSLSEKLHELAADESPFDPAPTGAGSGRRQARWVRPELVAQVRFAEWTRDGLLRQPSFKGLRDDVEPSRVVRERPADVAPDDHDRPPAAAARPSPPDTGSVAGVRLTHPTKRLFPDSSLTKAELARYYAAVAPIMLREIADRPLTLVRCPVGDGDGGCFYQRHPDKGLSPAVSTLRHALANHSVADEWLTVHDAAGLVSLAQMGCAEIHSWLSRAAHPTQPDRLVFDLDPGPGVAWSGIADAARILRDELTSLGLSPFVKSTGSKGLHVVCALRPSWEFPRVHAFAKAFAEHVSSLHPERMTARMAKSQREGRIFVDYVRNSEAASAVAAYSTRYLSGPPVAVPVAWEELEGRLDVRAFTPAAVLERVESGVDPWSELEGSATDEGVLEAAEVSLGA